jgi:RNA polymerase sigma-70 factor (ECF subfamily)
VFDPSAPFATSTDAERARLVRLCARLTHDTAVAEDLAQETLLEGWRNAHKLTDPAGRERWLAAIARNVCLRWARRASLERARVAPTSYLLEVTDTADGYGELERRELSALLGRALAQLPPSTRQALRERYFESRTHADIAGRLNLSEDAVAMRLTRGKQALKQLLASDFADEALAYGLHAEARDWHATRVWCPECGARHVEMRRSESVGVVAFRCPGCQTAPELIGSEYRLANASFARLLAGLTQPRTILSKTSAWAHGYFRAALASGSAPCTHCRQRVRLQVVMRDDAPPAGVPQPVLLVSCPSCGEASSTSFSGLLTSLPETQQFWRAHVRVRALPRSEVEVNGQAAVVASFESIASRARLDIVSARANLAVLGVHEYAAPALSVG